MAKAPNPPPSGPKPAPPPHPPIVAEQICAGKVVHIRPNRVTRLRPELPPTTADVNRRLADLDKSLKRTLGWMEAELAKRNPRTGRPAQPEGYPVARERLLRNIRLIRHGRGEFPGDGVVKAAWRDLSHSWANVHVEWARDRGLPWPKVIGKGVVALEIALALAMVVWPVVWWWLVGL